MKLLVAAVAVRPPGWVEEGWADYAKRMPRETPLVLQEIKPEPLLVAQTFQSIGDERVVALRVESREGEGARFVVSLPVVEAIGGGEIEADGG